MRVIDANCKPPFPAALPMRSYSGGVAVWSRTKRGMPPDRAFESRSMNEFLAEQKRCGIVRAIVHARAMGPGATPTASHEGLPNAAVAELCAAHPETFSAIGSLDPVREPNAGDAAGSLLDAGFVGIAVSPGYMPDAVYADDTRLRAVYEVCSARQRPVVILNGGNGGPDLSWSDPVHIDRVAATFPQLRIVVAYAGWPYVQPMMGVLYRRPQVWVMPDIYFPGLPGQQDYLQALRTYAQDRFLYSSCYPVNPQRAHLEQVYALPLSPLALDRYLYGNAAELFGL